MILVLNAGSSSLKYKLFDLELRELKAGSIERIGSGGVKDHRQALKIIIEKIGDDFNKIDYFGHRIVHGGDKFGETEEINQEVIRDIADLSILAPLHNPPALEVIKALKQYKKRVKEYACFDTAFFRDLPKEASYYPLPYEYFKNKKIKKYGFHGISHKFVAHQAAKELKKSIEELNLITIHLGAGSSMAAIEKGKPIETSMGFTPNDGLMMMTRTGGIDPSIVLFMQREMKLSLEQVEEILEKKSGIFGISGVSTDMKDVLFVAGIKVENKDYVMPTNIKCDREYIKRSELAINMFIRIIKKFIGGYIALLNKVDAFVFTGEIGFGSSIIRDRITENFKIKVITVKPNEELAIAQLIQKIQ